MDRITKEVIKEAKDRLVIVEWIDAYDSSEELDITDITLVKQVYETSGFFVEIKDDHMIYQESLDGMPTSHHQLQLTLKETQWIIV